MRSRIVVAVLLALGLGACSQTVGDSCDADADTAARTPFFRTDGSPAYSGQALLLENCASCHSEPGLLGAPAGMELDANLVTATGDDGIEQARRLLARQATIHRHRDLIYDQVVTGAMPPRGYVLEASSYADATGAALPGIQTEEGQEMLRNWLACGSPVVERTTPLAQACSAPSDCVVTNFCDTATSQCVGVGDVVPAGGSVDCDTPESTWPWIWACIFSKDFTDGGCNGAACHGGTTGGGLVMTASDSAFDALMESPGASSPSCMGEGPYVVPDDPDASLLVHKLEGVDETGAMVCGSVMPVGSTLSDAEIAVIRTWIMEGAAEM